MSAPSFITVFMAGMLAFASPCVLPLLPGYLALMTGQIASPQSPTTHSRPVVASLAFVLSFTTIFVAMGATASSLARLMLAHRVPLERTAGAAVALMGLATLGLTRLPLFHRDLRLHPHPPPGPCGSAMLGAAFALGWSPCIGPTLAAALAVAAGQASGSAWQGGFLLRPTPPASARPSSHSPWAPGGQRHLRAISGGTQEQSTLSAACC